MGSIYGVIEGSLSLYVWHLYVLWHLYVCYMSGIFMFMFMMASLCLPHGLVGGTCDVERAKPEAIPQISCDIGSLMP